MLGRFGEVQVMDWGVARLLEVREQCLAKGAVLGSHDLTPTLTGALLGTPSSMSPEQARGEACAVDERTDVFGLGALLYQLATGNRPYWGADTEEVLARARARKLNDPSMARARSKVPTALVAICARAMAERREDRYPSARALCAELERFLADRAVEAYLAPWHERLAGWVRRRPAVATGLLLGTAATLLALVTAALAWRSHEASVAARSREDADRAAHVLEALDEVARRVRAWARSRCWRVAIARANSPGATAVLRRGCRQSRRKWG